LNTIIAEVAKTISPPSNKTTAANRQVWGADLALKDERDVTSAIKKTKGIITPAIPIAS
jgi:hypothetical protein